MLSRVAENLFWMGRYLERAANTARLLDLNHYLSLDLEEQYVQWEPLIQITGDTTLFKQKYDDYSPEAVFKFLVLDPEYSNSAYSVINMARENGRSAKEYLPNEFWIELNNLFLVLSKAMQSETTGIDDIHELCKKIQDSAITLLGISYESMWQGLGYQFYKMGLWMERADKTSRFVHAKYFYLLPSLNDVGSTVDDLHWTALLHSLNALDIFHQQHGLVSPEKVVSFLVKDSNYPRSIVFCLLKTLDAWEKILFSHPNASTPLQLNELIEDIKAAKTSDIIAKGLHEFINDFQIRLNNISNQVQLDFF